MKLTDEELKGLAENLCGATVLGTKDGYRVPCWKFPSGEVLIQPCYCSHDKAKEFNPLANWNHLRLVLEALVQTRGWWTLLRGLASRSVDKIDFDFTEEVIKMALATRKEKK